MKVLKAVMGAGDSSISNAAVAMMTLLDPTNSCWHLRRLQAMGLVQKVGKSEYIRTHKAKAFWIAISQFDLL